MNWEEIDHITDRARIHGGWLVRVYVSADYADQQDAVSICFVPDPLHIWSIS